MPELRKIETSAAYTPSAGEVVEYLAEEDGKLVLKVKKSDGTEETLSGGSGVDTSDATATAADVPEGLIFYGADGKTTGTMRESLPAYYEDGIRVSEGYVKENTYFKFPTVNFYLCTEVFGPEKVSGYVVSGAGTEEVNGNYIPTDLTTEEGSPVYKHETAEYYYLEMWGEKGICTSPTQYPSEGRYCNAYDQGWTVNSGAEPAPTVAAGNITINADVPKTWNGYRTVQTSTGAFTLAEKLTKGLPYSRLTPAVGRVYSQDALIKTSYFRLLRPAELLMIPLVSNEWKADTGQELTIVNNVQLDCECFRFTGRTSDVNAPLSYSGGTLTISTWVKTQSSAVLFSLRNASIEINFEYFSNKVVAVGGGESVQVYAPEGMELGGDLKGRWTHFTVVLLPDKMKLYVNGGYWGEVELHAAVQNQIYTSAHVHTTYRGLTQNEHWVKDFRVYNREVTSAEISAICEENNPVK